MKTSELSTKEAGYLIDRLSIINERFYKMDIAVTKLDEVSQTKFAEHIQKQKKSEHDMILTILAKLSDKL